MAIRNAQTESGQLLSGADVGNRAIATPCYPSWFYDAQPPGAIYDRQAEFGAPPITASSPKKLANDGWQQPGISVTPDSVAGAAARDIARGTVKKKSLSGGITLP
jgi:hypothetical protein